MARKVMKNDATTSISWGNQLPNQPQANNMPALVTANPVSRSG